MELSTVVGIGEETSSLEGTALGGALAGALWQRIRKLVAAGEETPALTDRDRAWKEIVLATAL